MVGKIEAVELSFKYKGQSEDVPFILDGVNLSVGEGEFVAVLGRNGSGKSTLAKQFCALLLPSGGHVYIDGLDTSDIGKLEQIRRTLGIIFQNPENQLVSSIVEEDVAFGPENLNLPSQEIRERVEEALKIVEMDGYQRHATHKLSGGQKQRIAIAGVIALRPKYLVLDEPTSMLDPKGRADVMRTIRRLNEESGITVVLITHYMEEAASAGRVVIMEEGRILTDGKPKEVFSQVELMKSVHLAVPQVTELVYRLRKAGIELPADITEVDECVEALAGLLG